MPADHKITLTKDVNSEADAPSNTLSEATIEVDKMPSSVDLNQSLDLIDIEAPLEPGFDWTLLADSMLWMIVLLFILAALLKFGRRFYQPAALYWQLNRLATKHKSSGANDDFIPFDQAWLLYDWCLKLQKFSKISVPATDGMAALLVKVNQLGFSKQPASRETYLGLLDEAKVVLQASSGWRPFKARLITLWKSFVAGKF